eukprot:354234-Chlamydomonas_euryale.AAC.3
MQGDIPIFGTRASVPTAHPHMRACRHRWTTVAHMAAPRSSHAATALHGRLYIAGGQASGDNGVHDLVEVLEPAMNACRPCAPLCVARSGLGMCAL